MNEVTQRQEDDDARRSAQCNFSQPVILQAGAGTGKTAALVARILMWCLGPGWDKNAAVLDAGDGQEDAVAARTIERLVAITFTEKAAADMADRVVKGLVAVCNDQEVHSFHQSALELDASVVAMRARACLGVIDQLRVSTIHSFCRQVVARGALELEIHPAFEVDADESLMNDIIDDVIGSWWRAALGNQSDPDAIALLARGVGPAEIGGMLGRFLSVNATESEVAEDPYGDRRFGAFVGPFRDALDDYVANVAQPFDEGVYEGKTPLGVQALAALCKIHRSLQDVRNIEQLQEVMAMEGCEPDVLVKNLSKTKIGVKTIETASEGTFDRHMERIGSLRPFLKVLDDFDPELLRAAGRVVAPLLGAVKERARCAGVLNFSDLLRLACDLVQNHPHARERLQDGIDQLLLDEVQDTDPLQFEIVKALAVGVPAERLGLFIVGDPKQSIYGWRQADLRAYEEFLDHLVENGGVRHSLSVNFRSVPAILQEVSTVVSPVMIETPGLQPAFEDLLVCDAKQKVPAYSSGGRRPVEHWVAQSRNAKRDRDLSKRKLAHRVRGIEALAVAKDIAEVHARGDCGWNHFGILMRVTTGRDQLLEALRAAAIPYVVEGDRDFNRRREVLDMLSLVGVVLDPVDPLPLLGALRSSVVGLPDAAISGLWAAGLPRFMSDTHSWSERKSAELNAILGAAATATPEVPTAFDGWPLTVRSFAQNVIELREVWRTQPADLFVDQLRGTLHFDALETSRFLGAHRLSNIEKFLQKLQTVALETRGVAALTLRALRQPIVSEDDEEEATPGGESVDAVRVMTIHKAKGLSFKQMYLLGMSGNGKRDHRESCAAMRDVEGNLEWHMAKAASFGFPALEKRQRDIRDAELVRLFYVALTRAKDRLVTVGCNTELDNRLQSFSDFLFTVDDRIPNLNQLLEWVEPTDEEDELDLPEQLVALESAECIVEGVRWLAVDYECLEQDAVGERALPPLEVDTDRVIAFHHELAIQREDASARSARPLLGAPSRATDDEVGKGASSGGAGLGKVVATAVGTALHLAFEVGDEAPDFAAASRWLEGSLSPAQLPKAQAAMDETIAALGGGKLLERFQAIHPHILGREVDLLLKAEADTDEPISAYSGSIDLLYTDPADGAIVVADYKTDRVAVSELSAQSEHHQAQGQLYLRAAQAAFPDAPSCRFELWFLNHDCII